MSITGLRKGRGADVPMELVAGGGKLAGMMSAFGALR